MQIDLLMNDRTFEVMVPSKQYCFYFEKSKRHPNRVLFEDVTFCPNHLLAYSFSFIELVFFQPVKCFFETNLHFGVQVRRYIIIFYTSI